MKIVALMFLGVLLLGGETVQAPTTVALTPTDVQRFADIIKEETVLQSQFKADEAEKETIRLRTCMSGKLDLDHCGIFSGDGKSVTIVVPQPPPPAPVK